MPAIGENKVTSMPRSFWSFICPLVMLSRISSSEMTSVSVKGVPALAICRSRHA
jgi:hypothetical protein